MPKKSLKISGLRVERAGKEIVKGVDLEIPAGELHVLMGPNGSGKSSFAGAIAGNPQYAVPAGRISLDGRDLTKLPPDERARAGLFLSLQYPPEIPGLTVSNFLRAAANAGRSKPLGVVEFHELLKKKMAELKMDDAFASRGLNEGFSGGEKKRLEMLQMSVLEPKYAVLDETDSGLDVDALKVVAAAIDARRRAGCGLLVITHYARILEYLSPDRVHVMSGGLIVRSGGPDLAKLIEREGFGSVAGDAK